MRNKRKVSAAIVALALVWAATACEFRKGPDPTPATISAESGPFVTASVVVPAADVTTFGGGTIYYPTDTSQGTFGALVFAPGNLSLSSLYAWMGPRLASHGFVVFLMDTKTRFDLPPSRGTQLLAAVDYLVSSSPVLAQVDPNRVAVGGHSYGGGGALEAANARPSLQAALLLQPWNSTKEWPTMAVPTMIVGAEADQIAAVATFSEPIYQSIPDVAEKAYLELDAATHSVGTTPDVTQATYMLVWLKRYVDNDTRYEQFICPGPAAGGPIEEYRGTCPG